MRSFNHIPGASLDRLAPSGILLIVAPHPDDETLGCGGLIASAVDAGRDVRVVVLTDGAASHPGSPTYSARRVAALREAELRKGAVALGLQPTDVLTFSLPDGKLSAEAPESLADRLLLAVGAGDLGAIFATGDDDPHPDHQMAARTASLLAQRRETLLWNYPVRSHVVQAYLGTPQNLVRLDVTAALERKKNAIACHASQLGDTIRDDPSGFHLTAEDILHHTQTSELYRRVDY